MMDCLGPKYLEHADPTIGPNADPNGIKEAIHDASLLVMLNGVSGPCKMASEGDDHEKHIPVLNRHRVARKEK